MTGIRIGISANANGAHTKELLDGISFAQKWLELDCTHVWADDGRDPARAVEAAQYLANAEVPIVVGHLSAAAALAAVDVYRLRDVALIAPATSHPALNPFGYSGIQRAFGVDTTVAQIMIAHTPPGEEPIIVYQDQTYGLSLAFELETALTQRCIRSARFDLAGNDWLDACTRARGAVYVAGIHEVCAEAVRTIRRAAPGKRIALGDDCYTANFITLCGASAEGCAVTTPAISITSELSLDSDLEAGAQGYFQACAVAASVALQAVWHYPDLRGAKLGHAIRGQSWRTPFGDMAFDQRGDLRGIFYRTWIVKDGSFHLNQGELGCGP